MIRSDLFSAQFAVLRAVHPGSAVVERMRVGQAALAHQRHDGRQPRRLDELEQLGRRVGVDHAAAGVDDRLLGLGDRLRRLAHLALVHLRRRPPAGQVGARRGTRSRARPPARPSRCRRARGRAGRVRATWNASLIACGSSRTSWTSHECLTIGIVIPVASVSWKASVPIRFERTCPVMHTSGVESIQASAIGVTRFVAPGPGGRHRDADPARRARVALGHVARRPARGGRARGARSCRARSRRRWGGSPRRGSRT